MNCIESVSCPSSLPSLIYSSLSVLSFRAPSSLLAPLSTSRSWSAVGHRDLARIRIAEDPNLASYCRRSRRNHVFRQVHGLLPFPLRHPLIRQRLCRAGEVRRLCFLPKSRFLPNVVVTDHFGFRC